MYLIPTVLIALNGISRKLYIGLKPQTQANPKTIELPYKSDKDFYSIWIFTPFSSGTTSQSKSTSDSNFGWSTEKCQENLKEINRAFGRLSILMNWQERC